MGSLIKSDAPKLQRRLDDLRLRQLPFASALALTQLAAASRAIERSRFRKRFKLRRQSFLHRIAIVPAKKGDWPHQTSQVGHRDEWMVAHETGGQRRARKGRIAVPTPYVRQRLTAGGRVPKRLKPRELTSQGRGRFVGRDDRTALVQVDRRRKRARGKGRILFLLRRRIQIRKRWNFRENVRAFARRAYGPIFTASLEWAVRTARRT